MMAGFWRPVTAQSDEPPSSQPIVGDRLLQTVPPAPPPTEVQPLPDVAIPAMPGTAQPAATSRVFLPFLGRNSSGVPTPVPAEDGEESGAPATPAWNPDLSVNLRVLVLTATREDPTLGAIQQILDFVGVPYDLWVASERPGQLTADRLANGALGNYYAVMLTSSNLAYTPDNGVTWLSALSANEWTALWQYEAAFRVRQVSWYTFPTADYGFSGSLPGRDTTATPLNLTLTPQGRAVFTHLNPNAVLPVQYAWVYPAAVPAGDPNIQPLLTDESGNVFAATRVYGDGRENLSLTFSGNQYLVHSMALSYGLLNWATRGLFLGEFRTYMHPQIDDYFIANDIWTPETPCGTNLDLNPSGVEYRMTAADLQAVINWQQARRAEPTTRQLRLTMVFNGVGADPMSAGGGMPANDDLAPLTQAQHSHFFWVNHTYTHLLLNDINIPVAQFRSELQNNHQVARRLGFTNYNRASLVTPEISGLNNPVFLNEAYRWGIRYMVSDTSRPEQRAPSPNTGYPNPVQPGILMIPRHANNLFYNVSRPEEWVAEYNCLYTAFWGRALTIDEIIDRESDLMLGNLLRGDISPLMFHQANLRAYDGQRTLMTDLIDATLAKYNRLYRLPIRSLNEHTIGQKLAARAAFNQSGVTATLTGNQLVVNSAQGATVPITGICAAPAAPSASVERYNNQCTLNLSMAPGSSATLAFP